jgi:hypothetical protein
VDDRRVLSGIIYVYVIRHGLRWRDAPAVYGPHKTLDNRFVRWSVRPHLRRPGGRGRPAVAVLHAAGMGVQEPRGIIIERVRKPRLRTH